MPERRRPDKASGRRTISEIIAGEIENQNAKVERFLAKEGDPPGVEGSDGEWWRVLWNGC